MDYISIAEAAEKWNITRRRVQVLCNEGRIPGLTRFGKARAIPKDAVEPADARKAQSAKQNACHAMLIKKALTRGAAHVASRPIRTGHQS